MTEKQRTRGSNLNKNITPIYNDLQKLGSEFFGTFMLLLIIIGSGIMGNNLASGNIAIALLSNAIATGTGLYFLISIFGSISGAHFNPIVTVFFQTQKDIPNRLAYGYIGVQILGGLLGVWFSHFIFELPVFQFSTHVRTGFPQWASEILATTGLLLTIVLGTRHAGNQVPVLVGSYITAAYWFTSSTSFANPAVTIARSFSDTFAGIRPEDVIHFILAQSIGLGLGIFLLRFFEPKVKETNRP
ncbi:MIP family protein [Leptospira kobayashii]|uniref:MIP family protein n=1 Tax=Leptospira kobayashii TaxID=1917830 RepID=A0ABM7ULK6_9LEPT|nr:MIP family protein [Leptospira kobayashii]